MLNAVVLLFNFAKHKDPIYLSHVAHWGRGGRYNNQEHALDGERNTTTRNLTYLVNIQCQP